MEKNTVFLRLEKYDMLKNTIREQAAEIKALKERLKVDKVFGIKEAYDKKYSLTLNPKYRHLIDEATESIKETHDFKDISEELIWSFATKKPAPIEPQVEEASEEAPEGWPETEVDTTEV